MAKPQKNLAGSVGAIIENPILSNFKEGLDVLEYLSLHTVLVKVWPIRENCRCRLLDKTFVDVAQDCVVNDRLWYFKRFDSVSS